MRGVLRIDLSRGSVREGDIPADSVVLITGKTPSEQLCLDVEGKVKEPYKIGDARNPHSMGEANRDGHPVGRLI